MSYNTPQNVAYKISSRGADKAKMSFIRLALLSFLGGAFVAFGGLLSVVVVGGMPEVAATNPGITKFLSGALFPVGLILVVIAGGNLFTSDCTVMILPYLQRRVYFSTVVRILVIAYIFNFVGALFVTYVLSYGVDVYIRDPWLSYIQQLGYSKVNQSFYTIFWKGVGANWLVCLGIWMGFAAREVVSKCVGIWIPVMIFVTLGYEHSIANMYFIPAAIFSGADITWGEFIIKNLIPATIGNIVGGALLVGCIYWYIYMKEDQDF